jgi:hypothetical protein
MDSEPSVQESLTLEFFSHELQKADATSAQSMRRFCERYGLLLSPIYPSKSRALEGRATKGKPGYLEGFLGVDNEAEALQSRLAEDAEAFKGSTGFEYPGEGATIVAATELARAAVAKGEYPGRNIGAVVSINEVAYTLRLLQLATAIIAADDAGLGGTGLLPYLQESGAVQTRRPGFLAPQGSELFFDNQWPAEAFALLTGEIQDDGLAGLSSEQREAAVLARGEFRAIAAMQAVENARSFIAHARISLGLENAGLRVPQQGSGGWATYDAEFMGRWQGALGEGSLLEAIAANFCYVMDAKQDWLACGHCGRVFKFHKEYDLAKRYRQATFCKDSCRVMAANAASAASAAESGLAPEGDEPEGSR